MGCAGIPIIKDILQVELDKVFVYKTKWAGGAAYSQIVFLENIS